MGASSAFPCPHLGFCIPRSGSVPRPHSSFRGSLRARTRQYRFRGSHSTIPESSSSAPTTCSASAAPPLGAARTTFPCVYTCWGPSSLDGSLSRSVRELLDESLISALRTASSAGFAFASRTFVRLSCLRSHASEFRSVADMPRALLACSAVAALAALPRRHRPSAALLRRLARVVSPRCRREGAKMRRNVRARTSTHASK